MVADRGRQGKIEDRIGIARVKRLVGGFGTADALRELIALHNPTILGARPAMQRVDLISLGSGETHIRGIGAGTDQAKARDR